MEQTKKTFFHTCGAEDGTYEISLSERELLRSLAKEVAEIAALPIQEERRQLWKAHNDLKTSRPLVFIDPENGWNECIPPRTLVCRDPLARSWEKKLRKEIFWFRKLKDDRVIEPFLDVPTAWGDNGWGIPVQTEGGQDGGAYRIEPGLEDYDEDFPKLHYPTIHVDREKTRRALDWANELLGDILTVRNRTEWWWSMGLTSDFINLRGLEDFMCDMIVEPEGVHRVMGLLCDGVLRKLDFLEKEGLLSSNADGTYVGSGGFGYTDCLPHPQGPVTAAQMWGFVESQETSSVSPEHYREFVYPYHEKIARRFGLNCYGCCEPVDPRWKYVKHLPNLRRVSFSPWADWTRAEEYLGKNYVVSIKPNPSYLALPNMDEENARKQVRKALDCGKNCIPELIMKDTNTLGGDPAHASRWVEIVREEMER